MKDPEDELKKYLKYYQGENLGFKCSKDRLSMAGHTIAGKGIILYMECTKDEGYVSFNGIGGFYAYENFALRPLMHPLSSLTKPIIIEGYNEGKGFVPKNELANLFTDREDMYSQIADDPRWINETPFAVVDQLISWHFWIGDQSLFESGHIIDKGTI